jgi:hypothetical protein
VPQSDDLGKNALVYEAYAFAMNGGFDENGDPTSRCDYAQDCQRATEFFTRLEDLNFYNVILANAAQHEQWPTSKTLNQDPKKKICVNGVDVSQFDEVKQCDFLYNILKPYFPAMAEEIKRYYLAAQENGLSQQKPTNFLIKCVHIGVVGDELGKKFSPILPPILTPSLTPSLSQSQSRDVFSPPVSSPRWLPPSPHESSSSQVSSFPMPSPTFSFPLLSPSSSASQISSVSFFPSIISVNNSSRLPSRLSSNDLVGNLVHDLEVKASLDPSFSFPSSPKVVPQSSLGGVRSPQLMFPLSRLSRELPSSSSSFLSQPSSILTQFPDRREPDSFSYPAIPQLEALSRPPSAFTPSPHKLSPPRKRMKAEL